MKFVIQRVKEASVKVDDEYTGKIKKGYLVLIGVGQEDTKEEADKYIRKMINLRIFEDEMENKLFIKRCGWRIVVSYLSLRFMQAAEKEIVQVLHRAGDPRKQKNYMNISLRNATRK